jgi:hypothetical protein
MRKIKCLVLMICAAFVLLFLVDRRTTALADELPDLTAQWWQLMFSIPGADVNVNPINDASGKNCMVGQRGSTWFLGGSITASPITRSCSVPSGEALFFPVLNIANINTPGRCQQTNSATAKQLRAQIAPLIDGATDVSATVDGKAVANIVRVQSTVFAIALPKDNIFSIQCNEMIPEGVYFPGVDDGFYVRLPALGVGNHTIHLQGKIPALKFVQDITYNLTVVAIKSPRSEANE